MVLMDEKRLFAFMAALALAQKDRCFTASFTEIRKGFFSRCRSSFPWKYFYPCRDLYVDKGWFQWLVAEQTRNRPSNITRRYTYRLTDKGLRHFEELPKDVLNAPGDARGPNKDKNERWPWPKDMPKLDLNTRDLPSVPSAIIKVLRYFWEHPGYPDCKPGQKFILKSIQKHRHVKCKIRTLNKWLSWLEWANWIIRMPRITGRPDGNYKVQTTLYYMGAKVFEMIREEKKAREKTQ